MFATVLLVVDVMGAFAALAKSWSTATFLFFASCAGHGAVTLMLELGEGGAA